MIHKFTNIDNAGVFKDFRWNSDKTQLPEFKKISIIYGQNYSGKTTLSRIVRAFETKKLPKGFESATFTLHFDGKELSNSNITQTENVFTPRVYNEDYIRENITFFGENDTPHSKSFTVIGAKNVMLEQKIRELEKELGSDTPEEETGLYKDRVQHERRYTEKKDSYDESRKSLDQAITNSAKEIRSNQARYGIDVLNYNAPKLKDDFNIVLSGKYQLPTLEEINRLESIAFEKPKNPISSVAYFGQGFEILLQKTNEICSRKIGYSKEILELAQCYALEKWVHDGLELNKDRKACAFCGQPITSARWTELSEHFNEDSEQLRREIKKLSDDISYDKSLVESSIQAISASGFYTTFSSDVDSIINDFTAEFEKYKLAIEDLKNHINQRVQEIYHPISFDIHDSKYTIDFKSLVDRLNFIIKENNDYSKTLSESVKNAQRKLRLAKSYEIAKLIDYQNRLKLIQNEEQKYKDAEYELNQLKIFIEQKESEIIQNRKEQYDSKAGVLTINKILRQAMPISTLQLYAKEDSNGVVFEIRRGDSPAYNMSEGERSLIAFCYFIASLDEANTSGKKLTVWIDDPISSLDQNNIFAVFSIMKNKLDNLDKQGLLEQVLITTHNLIFLRYLIAGKLIKGGKECFFVQRFGTKSQILKMPVYIRQYGTEFNLWFENIYKCAVEEISDNNRHWYSTFGNNARRFMDFELYFKYPFRKDDEKIPKNDEALEEFWGTNGIPMILTDKMTDEYSHSLVDLESQGIAALAPEIHQAAFEMLNRIKENDKKQYNALLKSINIENDPLKTENEKN